jgi:hypothetical protein
MSDDFGNNDDSSPGSRPTSFPLNRPTRLPVYTTSPKYLWVPILICVAFSGLLSAFLAIVGALPQAYHITPPSAGPIGPVVDAAIFIGIGAVAAFLMILLVRRKGVNVLEKIMMVAFLILGTFILFLYFDILLAVLGVAVIWWLPVLPAFAITAALVYLYGSARFGDRAKNAVVIFFGVLIGSYLPVVIPTWTGLVILAGFSLYDIYSVRHGPIKEMMAELDGETAGRSGPVDLTDIDLDIGIGDLAFYSMLTSISLISSDWGGYALFVMKGSTNFFLIFFPFIFTVVGVLIGAFISYEFVKKSKILPGLPMSIFIGIGMLSLAMVIGIYLF